MQLISKKIISFPSGSAIEFYDNKYYLIGDDSNHLLILDSNLNFLTSVPLFLEPPLQQKQDLKTENKTKNKNGLSPFETNSSLPNTIKTNQNDQNNDKIFEKISQRLSKKFKKDLEACAIYKDHLFIFSSGSNLEHRKYLIIYHLKNQKKHTVSLQNLYQEILNQGEIKELNIEAAEFVNDKLLLFNRGNNTNDNFLILLNINDNFSLESNFNCDSSIYNISKSGLDVNSDADAISSIEPTNQAFSVNKVHTEMFFELLLIIPLPNIQEAAPIPWGVSGACYDKKNDLLILTASKEDTSNAIDDGTILGSALMTFSFFSKSLADLINKNMSQMNIKDYCLNNSIFKPQIFELNDIIGIEKIESICLGPTTENSIEKTPQSPINFSDKTLEFKSYNFQSEIRLTLVADNDDGKTVLVQIKT